MRVVTLGHTAVGKTTYMASLYSTLQRSYEGFTLRAEKAADHKHLKALAESIRRGTYPPATAQRSQYEFTLRFKGEDVLQFVWADYRGGSLQELSSDKQARLLRQDLAEADGLMILVAGDALWRGEFRRSQLGRMTAMVSKALGTLSRPISMAIVFTKSDLVPCYNKAMLELFSGLLGAIETSAFVQGALIPVACGSHLRNVAVPLFFALHAGVRHRADALQAEISAHRRSAADLQQRSEGLEGVIDWIYSRWNGLPTNSEMAAHERTQAKAKATAHKQIIGTVNTIGKYIEELALISRGRSVDDYATRLNQFR